MSQPPPAFLFRVDANAHVGLGHLQRCLSLAEALSRWGLTCCFAASPEPTAHRRVHTRGFEVSTISSPWWGAADVETTVQIAKTHGCSAVIVDSDLDDSGFLSALRKADLIVCAIDDSAEHAFPCHLVVNPDAHAPLLEYVSSSGDTQFLLGTQYAMLRPEFWESRSRHIEPDVRRVLVMMGGADTYQLTLPIVDMILELPGGLLVTAVVGPFFEQREQLRETAKRVKPRLVLAESPESVSELMRASDLAVSAGGQTLYEFACTGTPVVAVGVACNQEKQLEVLADGTVVRFTGAADDPHIMSAIRDAIVQLSTTRSIREAMSAAGQRTVDGRGALRVAEVLVDRCRVP